MLNAWCNLYNAVVQCMEKEPQRETRHLYHKLTAEDKKLTEALV